MFASIPALLEKEAFEQLNGSDDVKIERIISKGHTSPEHGWHDQDKSEWVLILQGAARLRFHDGGTRELKEGDFLTIPPHCKHRVEWTPADQETIWLAVHF